LSNGLQSSAPLEYDITYHCKKRKYVSRRQATNDHRNVDISFDPDADITNAAPAGRLKAIITFLRVSLVICLCLSSALTISDRKIQIYPYISCGTNLLHEVLRSENVCSRYGVSLSGIAAIMLIATNVAVRMPRQAL
jgi:hypothetical protein